MSTELREQWEQLYLPLRPLCTNDFIEGVYRQPRAKALEGYRYIEANPKTVSDLLVVDIDDANARAMALWEHEGMLPNVIVENPRNGHAHAVWALAAPFSRTEYARRKPRPGRGGHGGAAPLVRRGQGIFGADDQEPAARGVEQRTGHRSPVRAGRTTRGAGGVRGHAAGLVEAHETAQRGRIGPQLPSVRDGAHMGVQGGAPPLGETARGCGWPSRPRRTK